MGDLNDFNAELDAGLADMMSEGSVDCEQIQVIGLIQDKAFNATFTRDVLAMIDREAIAGMQMESRETTKPVIQMVILSRAMDMSDDPDGVGGVAFEELDRNLTRFKFPRRRGLDSDVSDPKGFRIKNIPRQTQAGMVLEF